MEASTEKAVILRPINTDNALRIFELTDKNRAYLAEWLPWVKHTTKLTDTTLFIKEAIRKAREETTFTAEIWYFKDLVGIIDLHQISKTNRRAYIGYWLSQHAMGNGIMTQAVKAMLDYSFEKFGLNRIVIDVAEENEKSRSIPERLGFVQEGILRNDMILDGKIYNRVIYSMLVEEWNNTESKD